jgi:hypothetical protein
MNKKEKLTSDFIGLKAMAIMFFIGGAYIVFIQDRSPFKEVIAPWGIALLIWIYAITRNKVYYAEEKIFIYNWKGKEIDIVLIDKISSMLFSGFRANSFGHAYRFFYNVEGGRKKEFWVFPHVYADIVKLEKRIKEVNPDLLTTNSSFGGIEHLFIRNEDGFR